MNPRLYRLRNSQHAPHFLSLPLVILTKGEGAAIYYINLACTPLLLSKISPTLHPTFQMHPTFYIMISPTTHFLLPLLYYRCTPISPVFYILHPTLGAKSKSIIYLKIFISHRQHMSNILLIQLF
jgi:hypothetical protein